MSNFIDELADYAAAQGLGTVEQDIFTFKQPASPDNCVSFHGLPGNNLGDQRDIPELTFPRVQVVVRNSDPAAGADKLTQVRSILHGLINVQLPSWRIMRFHCEQEGGPIGQDGQNRYEFSINFEGEHYERPADPTP